MNIRIKPLFCAILVLVGVSVSGFAQPVDLKELQKTVSSFSEELAKSLPFNSSLGLNWSDAYIGKLFPSLPPHFGVGASIGLTTMEMPVLKAMANLFDYKLPFDIGKMILPAYAGEARIGGLFLPFDIGFKFGYLPSLGLWGKDIKMNYLLVGGDLRYALLDKKIPPKISLGVGINYLKGGVGGKTGGDTVFDYGSDSITVKSPDVNLDWKTVSLDFKLQVSKTLLIFTPYLGVGLGYAWSSAGYSVSADIEGSSGNPLTAMEKAAIKDYLKGLGLDDVSENGISSTIDNGAFSFRAFGGLSINLMVFRLDFTALYSFRDRNFGGSFGFRFQL